MINILNRKIKRFSIRLSELEQLIDNGTSTSRQKQEYIEVKSKLEAYKDSLDIVEVMNQTHVVETT